MREGRHRWHPRPYLALPHAAGPYLATPDLVAGASYTAVLTPSSIPRPCRLAIPFLLDWGHKRLVLAGEDPGGDIGRAEGRVDGKIAAGFHRFRAIEAAVDRAGNARLCDVERVIGAVQRQFDGGGPCAETFPVEIADRQRAGLRAEIVGPVKAAGRDITGAIVEHRADRVPGIRVQTDYAALKLAHEQRQLEGLRSEAGPNPNSAQRKGIEAQEVFV